MISLYLGNEVMYAVDASAKGNKISVNNIYEGKISEGSIINGVITNEDALKYDIKNFWEENHLPKKNICIVTNSKQITKKNATMPLVSEKNLLKLVAMEFTDVEKDKPIYDYLPFDIDKTKKKMDVLAIMLEESFIQSYVNLFNDLGIKIVKVTCSIANLVKTYDIVNPTEKEGVFLVQILDGNNIVSLIFDDGKYKYSQSTRVFSDVNSPELINEIVNSISSIRQFYMSTSKKEIAKVYFGAISEDMLERLKISLEIYNTKADFMPDIADVDFNDKGDFYLYPYCIGSFVASKKDVNFLSQISKSDTGNSNAVFSPKLLFAMGGILGVMAVISASVLVRNSLINKSIESANEFINNSKNQEMVSKSSSISMSNQELLSSIEIIKNAKTSIETYPVYNTVLRNIILSCQDSVTTLKIIRFDADSGSIRIEANCSVTNYTYALIDRLEATGLFVNVDYSGYSFNSATNMYKINVDCTLAEGAGR